MPWSCVVSIMTNSVPKPVPQGYWQTHRLSRVGLHDANYAVLADALPRQSEHQPSQLLLRDLLARVGSGLRPDELSLVQPPRCQPDSDSVVDKYLQAVSSAVREEISVVRM